MTAEYVLKELATLIRAAESGGKHTVTTKELHALLIDLLTAPLPEAKP